MPHPQPGVASGLRIRRRPAPVLDQEHPQALGGRAEIVLGIDRAQHGVGGHARVERVDEPAERLLAADRVEE